MQKMILLIDDDEDEFEIFKMALETAKMSFFCIWANCLEQSIQIIKKAQPDYVFIDINMPRDNGFDCLNQLKRFDRLNHSIFVLYSTHISKADHDKAMQLGASWCIHKPENLKSLQEQLLDLFNSVTHSSHC